MKINKYDKIFSQIIRESSDWICEICGIQSPQGSGIAQMQCSHDRSRRYVITRYDPRNAICSCASCHRKTTEDHDLHVESFTRIKGGETRRSMRDLSQSKGRLKKFEKDEIYKHYKAELERILDLRREGVTGKIDVEVPELLL